MTKYYCDKCSRECTLNNDKIDNTYVVKKFNAYHSNQSILCLCNGCLLEFITYLPDDTFSKELKSYALSCK